MLSSLLALTVCFSLATASPLQRSHEHLINRNHGIHWRSCPGEPDPHLECGKFEVPYDYANHTIGTATLALVRYKVPSADRAGSLFINPGGPGGSGVAMLLDGDTAEYFANLTQHQYDITSWDPRGVNNSVPRVDCVSNPTEENNFWDGNPFGSGIEARGNFTDAVDIDSFHAQVDVLDEWTAQLGKKCQDMNGDFLKYVGTAAVARDLIAMADALDGPDSPVNYWGFSYGTVIGAYWINMFPSRVGRVILDGVVHPEFWAQKPPHLLPGNALESADEVLEGFALACAQAGSNCVLNSAGSTPISILEWIRGLIDKSYDFWKEGHTEFQGYRSYKSGIFRNYIFQMMYSPNRWPELAEDLLFIDQKMDAVRENATDGTHASDPLLQAYESTPLLRPYSPFKKRADDAASGYALTAVTCADAIDAGSITTKDILHQILLVAHTVTGFFGVDSYNHAGNSCHKWPVRAVERYAGPWNNKLANPILVIGNEADPITPYNSAKWLADALGDNAVLVEQDDYGHTSHAMWSPCTESIVSNYLVDGKLPTVDEFCATDTDLFDVQGLTRAGLKK